MDDLTNLTVCETVEAVKRGEFSCRELVEAYLDRIDRLETQLNAFISLMPELALAQADKIDRTLWSRRKSGDPLALPLAGLPIAVKDVLCVENMPCTCGSRMLENYVPPFNATCVQRLLEAGVVILGKTNTDEFAMGSSTENSAFGVTHNPWNLERVPGGSSGGSAAAVAAHMVTAALGTDTGGSIRQPASFCGITGIKPTYGRISRYGLVAYGSSLDTPGVLGHTAADVCALFGLMAGYDPLDSTSSQRAVPKIHLDDQAELPHLRIGVPKEYFGAGIQPEVERGVHQAIETFESLGAEIITVSLPHTEYALPVYYLIAPAEASANLARYDGIRYGSRVADNDIGEIFRRTRGEKLGAEVKRRIMLGTYALSAGYYEAYYGQAQRVRTLIKRDFDQAFEQANMIAAPVSPTTAFPIGAHTDDPLAMYLEDIFTLPANLAGVPALAFPVGFDADRLPIGMQLIGPHFTEEMLFSATHAYQQVTDWHMINLSE
ncbi:MAG: Asp-tRNA(Asn)/Glu-tRNA(Gln) amidotransferase subunit GatA [Anaerolineales bacterium]